MVLFVIIIYNDHWGKNIIIFWPLHLKACTNVYTYRYRDIHPHRGNIFIQSTYCFGNRSLYLEVTELNIGKYRSNVRAHDISVSAASNLMAICVDWKTMEPVFQHM